MAKNRVAVTCNGKASFYAAIWEDIRRCAMDNGWAVALHGSLSSDIDIMAMPWTEEAIPFQSLVKCLSELFEDNMLSSQWVISYGEKPFRRIVATIPIYDDYYLDISTMSTPGITEAPSYHIGQIVWLVNYEGEAVPKKYLGFVYDGKIKLHLSDIEPLQFVANSLVYATREEAEKHIQSERRKANENN